MSYYNEFRNKNYIVSIFPNFKTKTYFIFCLKTTNNFNNKYLFLLFRNRRQRVLQRRGVQFGDRGVGLDRVGQKFVAGSWLEPTTSKNKRHKTFIAGILIAFKIHRKIFAVANHRKFQQTRQTFADGHRKRVSKTSKTNFVFQIFGRRQLERLGLPLDGGSRPHRGQGHPLFDLIFGKRPEKFSRLLGRPGNQNSSQRTSSGRDNLVEKISGGQLNFVAKNFEGKRKTKWSRTLWPTSGFGDSEHFVVPQYQRLGQVFEDQSTILLPRLGTRFVVRNHFDRRNDWRRFCVENGDETFGSEFGQTFSAEFDFEWMLEVDGPRPGHRCEDVSSAGQTRDPELRQHHKRRSHGPRIEVSAHRSPRCFRYCFTPSIYF